MSKEEINLPEKIIIGEEGPGANLTSENVIIKDIPNEEENIQVKRFRSLRQTVEKKYGERCTAFLNDLFEGFDYRAPAAVKWHHNREFGLIEHCNQMTITLSGMMHYLEALIGMTGRLNADLVCFGILIHDHFKGMHEHYIELEDGTYTYPEEKRDHIKEMVDYLKAHSDELNEFLEGDETDNLIGMVASHHGRTDWGALHEPRTTEQIMLHQIDMVSSQVIK